MNIFDIASVQIDKDCLNHDFDEYDLYGERIEEDNSSNCDIELE